jgi:single-strand DNA-binding protein
MNLVVLKGKLGQDPEARYTSSGKAVVTASLATNKTYNDASGNRQTKTTWHNLKIWGKRGEAFAQYLKKGDEVLISKGSNETEQWEKDGQKKISHYVLVDEFEFCGGKKNPGGCQSGGQGGTPADDDDFPF